MVRVLAVFAHKLNRILPRFVSKRLRNSKRLFSWYAALIQKNRHFIDPNYVVPFEIPKWGYFPSSEDYNKNIVKQNQIIRLASEYIAIKQGFVVVILMPTFDFVSLQKTLSSLKLQAHFIDRLLVVTEEIELCKTWLAKDSCGFAIELVGAKSNRLTFKFDFPSFVCFSGEVLHEKAFSYLSHFSPTLKNLTYCDTDVLLQDIRQLPHFYPDWNPDYQLSANYIRTGVIVPQGVTIMLEELSKDTVSTWLKNLYLSDSEIKVDHIPLVLIHRPISLLRTLNEGCNTATLFNPSRYPRVSLIVPTYNGLQVLKTCIESILEKTTYQKYEIIIVNNNSDDEATLSYLETIKQHENIDVLEYPKPFNYSAINNFAVRHAKGEIIGLVNNDIEVITPEWLEYMVTHVQRPDIGCVGAKLLYPNDLVQHAGVVMGYGGGAGHAHKFFPREHPGYLARAVCTQNFSAVTAACLLVKKSDYEAVNGLNEVDLTVAFNDVDFCLRVLELGRRNLLCAEAELYHHESITRGHEDTPEKAERFTNEVNYLKTKWSDFISHDPAYNPNLTLRYENFSIKLDE
ncbi:glycosyltransferase family 2 protein [Agaribacter flavus]|uniref:Glycosyltransferase n=1 Tax=Agaribacter flavus TaxID=1902781 RepID=A0ABV7FTY1_9ALTE